MPIHIGTEIWKQMKIKGMSRAGFALAMEVKLSKISSIIHSEFLDIRILMKVSEILEYNFFHFYADQLDGPEAGKIRSLEQENEVLRELVKKKNKLIALQSQSLAVHESIIKTLEKE